MLLLVLLPLQFSWAAVGEYCAHGAAGTGLAHDGVLQLAHHDHGDHGEPAPDSADAAATDGSTASPPDCGHTHRHGHVVGLLEAVAALPLLATGARPPAAHPARLALQPPTPPERPQWARLA